MNYKILEYDYDKDKLSSLYVTLANTEHLVFRISDLSNIDKTLLPMMNVFNRELYPQEYGLAELLNETGMHVSPRNNGLIIFPVTGLINFTFVTGETIDITQPTIINGTVLHNYYPKVKDSVFFAIKIPTYITYEECCLLS